MSDYVPVECAVDERGDVAAWLIATADAKGIDRRLVLTRNYGFLVPAELLDEAPEKAVIVPVAAEVKGEIDGVVEVSLTLKDGREMGTVAVPVPEPDRETVRAWAKENGFEVADKGRLKQEIYAAYAAR